MPGETNLSRLLASMAPELQPGAYVFCTVQDLSRVPLQDIIGSFREAEGWTLILSQPLADQHRLPYTFVAAWLTLTVHSALEAVGLTGAFATALAQAGISCNVVAAYHHDHIFVAYPDADRALQVLQDLAASAV